MQYSKCLNTGNFIVKIVFLFVVYLDSDWVLCTPNTGQSMLFHHFSCKKAEKGRGASQLRQNLVKKCFFEIEPEG